MSRDINLNLIDPDQRNARKHFDEAAIMELAQSIKASGLAQPIMVRPVGDRFTIVHGERRYRAITSLGWATIPADVRDIDEETASWLALAENLQRADLSPIEEAQAYQVKLASGITQSELGRRLGKTQSYIAQKLRLLTLPDPIQHYIRVQTLTEGHARQLLRLKDFYGDLATACDLTGFGEIDLSPKESIFALTIAIRPLDRVFGFYVSDDKVNTHYAAALAFKDYVTRHKCSPPAWSISAYFFAVCCVDSKMSVTETKDAIDNFIDHIMSAIVFTCRHDYKTAPDKEQYGGYASDLRHARFPRPISFDGEMGYMRPLLLKWLEDDRPFYYPSGWSEEQVLQARERESLNSY